MIKRNYNLIFLMTIGLWVGCDECNDCQDLQSKVIVVQNDAGNNLLFGESALFNPQMVMVTTGNERQPVLINTDNETIEFSLTPGNTEYLLTLDANTAELLSFDLSERESERCCGNQTFSTATRLNGEEVDNFSTIIIVN